MGITEKLLKIGKCEKLKKILIVHSNMEMGGAETSLIGLLNTIDYTKYQVDLFLQNQTGDLLKYIPKCVDLLPERNDYKQMQLPLKKVIKNKYIGIFIARLLGKLKSRKSCNNGYEIKLYSYLHALKQLSEFEDEYDLGISFIDPHWIIEKNVKRK